MDTIQECALNFSRLLQMKYHFVISHNRKTEDFIEASDYKRKATVYIFIRKRLESDNYVIVSFFKKHNVFRGVSTYWMLKEKYVGETVTELYRHVSYKSK